MSTLKVPAVTVAPSMESDPQTLVVRPTAVAFWPTRTSWTRYPAIDPGPTFHVPETADAAVVCTPGRAVVDVVLDDGSSSLAGVGPSMKWM